MVYRCHQVALPLYDWCYPVVLANILGHYYLDVRSLHRNLPMDVADIQGRLQVDVGNFRWLPDLDVPNIRKPGDRLHYHPNLVRGSLHPCLRLGNLLCLQILRVYGQHILARYWIWSHALLLLDWFSHYSLLHALACHFPTHTLLACVYFMVVVSCKDTYAHSNISNFVCQKNITISLN